MNQRPAASTRPRSGKGRWALALAALVSGMLAAPWCAAQTDTSSVTEIHDRLAGIDEILSTLSTDVGALKKLRVSGYVQARYERHFDTKDGVDSSGTTQNKDEFFIRRGRLKVTYTPGTSSQLVLQIDAARASVALRDAYVKLTEPWTGKEASLTVGQMSVPFGYEIERSSSVRELPERSRAEQALFPGERDRGAKLILPLHSKVTLTGGIWNGPGINDRVAGITFPGKDPDNDKDLTARAAVSLGKLDFGGSIYAGSIHVPTAAGTAATAEPREFTKNRTGADAQIYFELPGIGGGSLKGESYWAKDVAFPQNQGPRRVEPFGWYVMAVQNLGEKVQAVGRLDRYDPDTDIDDNATNTWAAALNYFWDGNVRLTLAYDHPVLEEGDDDLPDDDFVTLQFQLVY